MSQLPDGPKLPRFRQLINWIVNPFGYLEECAQRYGDIFTLRLSGFEPLVIISHPQGIQEIFTANAQQFDIGRSNGIIRPLVGDNSLLLLDGDRHRQQRKLLMPPFHGESLQVYSQLICQITEHLTSQWQPGKPFTARSAMQAITLEVIIQVVFGLRDGKHYQAMKPLLAEILDLTGSPLRSSLLFFSFLQKDFGAWSPWGRMKWLKQQIYNLLQAEINERRAQSELRSNDILSLMLTAQDENGQSMTDEELKDEMMTLLVAGHETTATSLAWALYWLHKLPQVRERLLQELDSLGENPQPIALTRLPYLTAVCQETLRIYPVVPMVAPRIVKSSMQVMGHSFVPETLIAPCIYLVHHREDLYPAPKQFRPERFLERHYSPSEYFPFGGGNRRCLGHALAMLEMKLVLATVLSRYQLVLVDDKPVMPERRGVTLAPSGGVAIRMVGKRKQPLQPAKPLVSSY